MKKKIIYFAISLVGIALFFPTKYAAALGPNAANCNWGNYSLSNTTYLSPQSGENNQNQINDAITNAPSGGSVFLRSGRYIISGPIYLKSNITLEGDSDAIIQLKDHANWKTLSYDSSTGVSIKNAILDSQVIVSNIEIKCFQIDGNFNFRSSSGGGNYDPDFCACIGVSSSSWATNMTSCENQYVDRCTGSGYYGLIEPMGGNNLSVHDMVMQDGGNDFLDLRNISNVSIYNNYANGSGHEFINAYNLDNLEIYGNKVAVRINSGFRIDGGCTNVGIYNNEVYGFTDSRYLDSYIKNGGYGVQIARDGTDNIEIFNNVFYDIRGMGIGFTVGTMSMSGSEYPVVIHHNLFVNNGLDYATATGGVVSTISAAAHVYNNTIDSNYGYGIRDGSEQMLIENNIITNTDVGQRSSASGNGTGVYGGKIVSYNVFYGNAGSDYTKSGTGNLHADPLYANPGAYDYHLKSVAGRWDPNTKVWTTDATSSPGIDAGNPSSLYSNEPVPNGGVVNAGYYGNTTQSSLSGTTVIVPPDPVYDSFSYTPTSSESSFSSSPSSSPIVYSTSFVSSFPGTYSPSSFVPSEEVVNEKHTLNVVNGSGSGDYYAGEIITIVAYAPSYPLQVFRAWYGATDYIADPTSASTTITMPDEAATVTALYVNDSLPAVISNSISTGNIVDLMINILQYLLSIAGVIGMIVIVIGGIYYIASSGNEEKATRGKRIVTFATIGLVVIIVSYAIISTIEQIFVK